jgi:diadenosine tetraphosphate (Ap4A) HIT family hydrolase
MAYDRNNVFARILRGEIPCKKVYEDEHVLAFDDITARAPTHVLVIPKGEYVSLDDFSEKASAAELAAFVRALGHVARARGVAETGYRILANIGRDGHQEVPHFHAHVVGGPRPRRHAAATLIRPIPRDSGAAPRAARVPSAPSSLRRHGRC